MDYLCSKEKKKSPKDSKYFLLLTADLKYIVKLLNLVEI